MATHKDRLPLLAFSATALSFCIVGVAAAQDGSLAALLNSGNGQITSAQAEVAARDQFSRLDSNHDGVVTETEFVTDRMRLLQAADSNGDGTVTRSEMRSLVVSHLQNRSSTRGQ